MLIFVFDFSNKINADMQQLQRLLQHLVKMSLLIFIDIDKYFDHLFYNH